MIRISGKGSSAGLDRAMFPGSYVFLADESLARAWDKSKLGDALAAAVAGGPALVWVTAETPPRFTVVPMDDSGCLRRPLHLATGATLPAGGGVVVGKSAGGEPLGAEKETPRIHVGVEGADAGLVTFEAEAVSQAWIRYFYYATRNRAADKLGCYRFCVFEASSIAVQFDPSRPFDGSRSFARPISPVVKTRFRTRWGNAVTLTAIPNQSQYVYAWDPMQKEFYLTLDGFWQWGVADVSPSEIELMLGFSGTEYARASQGWVMRFVSQAPAFAPAFQPGAAEADALPRVSTLSGGLPLIPKIDGVAQDITTSWIYFLPAPTGGPASLSGPAGKASYFSQPVRAGLFTPDGSDGLLRTFNLEAAPLPPNATTPYAPFASFPAVPYAGLESPSTDETVPLDPLRRFEAEVLSAARTKVINELQNVGPVGLASRALRAPGASGITGPTGPTGPTKDAVTPQGLLSVFSIDGGEAKGWNQLILAQTNHGQQLLRLTEIKGPLRAALLANQLFLVVSNPERLYQSCSTTYCISDQVLAQVGALIKKPTVIAKASSLCGIVYQAAEYFCPALRAALGDDDYGRFRDMFLVYAELAQLTIADWTFDVSKRTWGAGSGATKLIIKFADDDLDSLAADLSRWTLPQDFNDDPAHTQGELLDFIKNTRDEVASKPELRYFVDTVLAKSQVAGRDVWNGVLYLNASVPTNAFPPDLRALAAGIPDAALRAHHLGVTLSSFDATGGRISISDSSLFGVILYQDDKDLIYQGEPYDFKVQSLRVSFANSDIASFSSRVELLVGQLFGELANLESSLHGDNLVFEGTLQKGTYQFATTLQSRFAMTSHVLDQITISRGQFVTVNQETTAARTVARFILSGSMTFQRLGDFDLFGYGPSEDGKEDGQLCFSGLFVSMAFDPDDAQATRQFSFQAGQMTFDASSSRARSGSLFRRFPLQITAMRQATADAQAKEKFTTPADLGFIPVETPLGQGTLGPLWFGLEMSFNFGSPGALAPKLGFSSSLLASWAPSASGYNVAVGLTLPGSTGGKKSMTIMGPLRINIGRLMFLFDQATQGYLLRLQNVALSLLGLSFPPGGKTNALLFGDPDPRNTAGRLGWYLAYLKDKEKKEKPKLLAEKPPVAQPAGKGGCTSCHQ